MGPDSMYNCVRLFFLITEHTQVTPVPMLQIVMMNSIYIIIYIKLASFIVVLNGRPRTDPATSNYYYQMLGLLPPTPSS